MIGRASRQLPPEMPSPPSYQKVNPADQSIFFIVLRSSTLSLAVLDETAQDVERTPAHGQCLPIQAQFAAVREPFEAAETQGGSHAENDRCGQ